MHSTLRFSWLLAFAACADGTAPPPLAAVLVQRPEGGDITDEAAAVRLGKALFWDVQVGSDGITACASCHFAAGADDRTKDAIHPGPDEKFDTGDDRAASPGVVRRVFESLGPVDDAEDICREEPAPLFDQKRQVTKRNTPTAIGAMYFVDNLWDGRASSVFNGIDPFGETGNSTGSPQLRMINSSLASQAVGPANDEVEMACAGRTFDGPNGLGAKLLSRRPLALQAVRPTDSVLGRRSASPDPGLRCSHDPCTYRELIAEAFGAALAEDAENQFARLFGQAIQAYELTLIPDATPFDRFLAGDPSALTQSQQDGMSVFFDECQACHAGAELSDATFSFRALHGEINADGGDQGFHNIGVRPTEEDLGRAELGKNRISFSRSGSARDRGAFKTPALRNVKLTAPYFHNGGKATLEAVVDFYDNGGDFKNLEQAAEMNDIDIPDDQKDELVDFLRNALTDCRVEKRRAPFDHPSLALPDGREISATGAEGLGSCP